MCGLVFQNLKDMTMISPPDCLHNYIKCDIQLDRAIPTRTLSFNNENLEGSKLSLLKDNVLVGVA